MNISELFINRRRRKWASLNKNEKKPPVDWEQNAEQEPEKSVAMDRENVPDVEECPSCHKQWEKEVLLQQKRICPDCGHYFALSPLQRIELISDPETFRELDAKLSTENPLDFPDYDKKVEQNRQKTGQTEAVVTGVCRIQGIVTAIGVMDSRFLMGSMGTAVGEKVSRLAEYAGRKQIPMIIFCASGGARMQEGLFSLMQMAKTGAAVEKFKRNGGLYISFLTHPTTGGVSASFATLGDIILAEPNALIGFAGPRVIEQTIGQKLPEGFQRAEFLLEHGMIDQIVARNEIKETLGKLLKLHHIEKKEKKHA